MRYLHFTAALLALTTFLAAMPVSETDAVAIAKVVQDTLHVRDFDATTAREKDWAVEYWTGGNGYGPGQALVRNTAPGTWIIVKMTMGSLRDVKRLESLGVPAAIARAIYNDLTAWKVP